ERDGSQAHIDRHRAPCLRGLFRLSAGAQEFQARRGLPRLPRRQGPRVAVLAGLSRLLLSAVLVMVLGAAPASAVFGGKVLRDSDPLAKSVAAILYRDDTGAHLCTAVALGPKLLLTAAHCTAGD